MKPQSVEDWAPYLPDGQRQSNGVSDEADCATFSMIHCIETQCNYLLSTSQFKPEALEYFDTAGYLVNGKFKFSDLFNAILNGTTQNGNTMLAVDLSVCAIGLLPWKDFPLPEGENWAQYMANSNVTQEMKDKAVKILDYINITPRWIYGPVTSETLATAPVQLSIAICPDYVTAPVVAACSQPVQHCVMQYGNKDGQEIFDTILPFQKTLATDYKNFGVMQYVVTPAIPPLMWSKAWEIIKTL